ncbi:hypothetical protein [Natronorubrum halophilum]|uniref:hypothetical protein n=1 Tax=Natronorubrum halophilum TaxID=1702106 RepID=UPI001484F664|nr:hypothetical protein [Natronorubrum halophilum]
MYSSSRGILYSAPPQPDETDGNRAIDAANASTANEDDADATASGSADAVTADD